MGLVFSISNFFTNKTSVANKWMSFSSSNLALEGKPFTCMFVNIILNIDFDSFKQFFVDLAKVVNMTSIGFGFIVNFIKFLVYFFNKVFNFVLYWIFQFT